MIGTQDIVARLALAALLGSLIGLERGRQERAAGLRTHALVGVGSCLFMLVSAFGFNDVHGDPQVMLDPSRVAAQVASGIGFLGAGTIILQREIVKGLTTAASIWAVAALGLAVGGGMYVAAACTTALVLLILAGVKPLERRLRPPRRQSLRLVIDQKSASIRTIRATVEEAGLMLEHVLIEPGETPDEDRVELSVRRSSGVSSHGDDRVDLVDRLRRVPGIQRIDSVFTTTASTKSEDTETEDTDAEDAAEVETDAERRRTV